MAAAPQNVAVRGGQHQNFNRLVFDFKKAPRFQVQRDGSQVLIDFNVPMRLQPDRLTQRLPRVRLQSDSGPDGRVALTVAADAVVNSFVSGNSIVIDVRGAAVPEAAAPGVAAAAPAIKPAAPEVKPAAAPVPETKVLETAALAAPVASSPPPVPPAPAPITGPTLLQQFDARASIPAAVYARGDFVYVVFDRRLRFEPLQLFDAAQPTKPEALPVAGFSAYRLPLPPNALPLLKKSDSKWQIDLMPVKPDAAPELTLTQGLRLRAEPDFSLGARVVIPVRGAGQVLSLIDPAIGDTLFIIPTTNVEDHIVRPLRYADFEVLPSLQGVAIRTLNDGLSVRLVEEGIEITAPAGLQLAPPVIQAAEGTASPNRTREDVIPLTRWQQPELGTFTEGRQLLQQRVVEAVPALRDRARLELARYFAGHGYGIEARALLTIIAQQSPDIKGRPEFQILQAVAAILARDGQGGLKALEATGLSDRDDVRLWRAVAFAEQGQFSDAAADFAATLLLLENYPEPFFRRFARLAAESFMAAADDANAERVLDNIVKRGGAAAANDPPVLYLRGAVQARSGSLEIARKLWQQAADSTDYLARTRAELALVDMDVAAGKLPVADAVRRLEGLRFAWRGDALELELLTRLAEYQLRLKKPLDALDTYGRAKAIFPDSPQSAALNEAQQKIFRDIFLDANQNQYTPLQLLGIYDRFKATLPPDAPETQQIVDRVVSEMLAIDLLPQAISLLQERAVQASDASLKNEINLRLAAVMLLNKQADDAEPVLQGLDITVLNAAQSQERKLMLARAASDQNKFDAAFALLADDSSADAQRLLATTAWRAKDWPRAAAALANVIGNPVADQPLNAADAQLVLARAVALSLAGDRAGLSQLATNFSAAMSNLPQAQAFALLTRDDLTAGAATLARVREQVANVDLFQGFLENYRKAKTP